MSTFHKIGSTVNDIVMVGEVGGGFFRVGSASGPLGDTFTDLGPVEVGENIRLGYNYATDEYVTRDGGWYVTVVRINTKSITVRDARHEQGEGKTYRVDVS